MRILVVGGTSSLASALKPILSEFAEVITAGRKACDVRLDLSDPMEKFELPEGIDTVINAAAHFGGKEFAEIFQAESVNVLGSLKLCQACLKAGVKQLVTISSIFADLGPASHYYGIYALSKKHSDEVAQLFCSSFNLPCAILRPSQIYGNDDTFRRHQPFLYMAIDRAAKGEDISIYGNNDALRNYIHVDDVARTISLVVKNKIEGTYTCISDADVRLSQIAQFAFDAFGSSGKVRWLGDRPAIPDNIFKKDDSLFKKISRFPQITIEDGIKKIASHRLSQP